MNRSEKDKYHMISLMWNLRNKMNRVKKKKKNVGGRGGGKPRNRLLTIGNTLMVTRGEVGGGWVKYEGGHLL